MQSARQFSLRQANAAQCTGSQSEPHAYSLQRVGRQRQLAVTDEFQARKSKQVVVSDSSGDVNLAGVPRDRAICTVPLLGCTYDGDSNVLFRAGAQLR